MGLNTEDGNGEFIVDEPAGIKRVYTELCVVLCKEH